MRRHKFDALVELITYSTERTDYTFRRPDGTEYVLERTKGEEDRWRELVHDWLIDEEKRKEVFKALF